MGLGRPPLLVSLLLLQPTSLRGRPFTFDNGVTIARPHASQLRRYESGGLRLHEPEEERWFVDLLFEATAGSVLVNIGAAAGYYALLALRYRPPLAVVALNPHPAFQAELRENAAAANVAVADASSPSDPAAIPRSGGILQLGCALADSAKSGYMGGGYGTTMDASAKSAARDIEVRQARSSRSTAHPAAVARAATASATRRTASNHTAEGRLAELVGRVVQVRSVSLSDVLDRISPSPRRVFMATFDIQGFETQVFASDDTRQLLRAQRIERLLVGTHSAAAHREVLSALSQARFVVLYNESAVAGQPDGLIVAVNSAVATRRALSSIAVATRKSHAG